mgnify:CR=1 FL=1
MVADTYAVDSLGVSRTSCCVGAIVAALKLTEAIDSSIAIKAHAPLAVEILKWKIAIVINDRRLRNCLIGVVVSAIR